MRRRSLVPAAALSMSLLLAAPGVSSLPAGAAPAGGAREGQEPDLLDAPRSGEDAIRRLGAQAPVAAARNGLTVAELHAKLRSDQTFFADKQGRLVVHDTGLVADATGTAAATTAAASAVVPYDQTFALHSRPGASRVIYLDFDGHDVAGTAWNANYTNGAPFTAAPYDTDGLATFSTTEQDVVQSVWARVAEDFSAFDVDVTTQDPGDAAITRSGSADLAYGTRALITNTSSVYSSCSCGGIAYVGTFDITSNHAYYQPAFVFQRGVGAGAHNIAEAASHEVGHNLGLSHDGTATTGYYTGHNGWAPIMGVGYQQPLTQWSKGEYTGANNTEDDWSVMQANGAPVRADDHGSSAATATDLTGTAPSVSGRVAGPADTDWFRFTTPAGAVSLRLTPASISPDLDASLTLFDSAGQQVAVADPGFVRVSGDVASGLDASLSLTLAAGTYTARVDGVGFGTGATGYTDYGSAGQYTLTASIPDGPVVVASTPSAPTAVTATAAGRTVTVRWTDTSSDETGFTVVREKRSKNGTWGSATTVGTLGANATTFTNSPGKGTFRYSVRATNSAGSSAAATSNLVTI